ncbi:hypothetical protein Acsp06_39050 [Actinomycetospora sp. NBRC 106375]|uniref:hypothetical protein n=1 Tax=Actinomycetospora sp. NBRC 106375 TaxID=3032207 RepID=UPI0024A2EAE2|nr:hypothetical protein [Actinomycetospora sp. NBRC 106375]GLZ47720.1 hypothetical protein Acsp06_39050 [Actinomycetospora sp. NBRC 106375]
MAKEQKDKRSQQDDDPVATALTSPDAPISSNGGAASAGSRRATPKAAPRTTPSPAAPVARTVDPPAEKAPAGTVHGLADSAVSAVEGTAWAITRVLPHRGPVYLGGAALLVLGVVDLPVALGGALAYEALRRWEPARPAAG